MGQSSPCIELPRWFSDKESVCQCRRHGFNPWPGKIPWRSKRQPTPVFLPGKSHGQRSLAGYSPWGHKRVRHDLATKTTKQETIIVSKVFPWVLCAVLANHKPEERIVETPDFQPVGQKYLGLGLVSEVGAVLWNWILYLVGPDANSRYIVLELNCWTPMWCLKSWQIGLVWGNIHTFGIRSIMSKSCSEAAITKYHRLGGGASGKDPACQCRRWETGAHPWVGKIPWRRARQPTPVFLPGESHG